jgi:hypothetical protein
MSQLEVEAAPILTPLITAQCKIDSLSRLECLTLAKWTYKTVFMMLSAQRDVDVPWRFLNLWYENRIQNPDPAIIFALTELSLPKAFYYCIDTDHFTDVDSGPFNIRVGICINSLILIALIPSNDDPRQPGAPVLLNSPVSYRATLASGSRDYSDSAIFTKE